jgi:hypothetical protein
MDEIEIVHLVQDDEMPTQTFFTPPVRSARDQALDMLLIEKEIMDKGYKNVE